jgi:hypothetical protein
MPPDRAKANAAPTNKRILVIVSSPDRRVTLTIWPTDRLLRSSPWPKRRAQRRVCSPRLPRCRKELSDESLSNVVTTVTSWRSIFWRPKASRFTCTWGSRSSFANAFLTPGDGRPPDGDVGSDWTDRAWRADAAVSASQPPGIAMDVGEWLRSLGLEHMSRRSARMTLTPKLCPS